MESTRREDLERLVAERTAELSREVAVRRLAENTINESRAKLSAALESMTDAVFISDKEGNLIESNNAFSTYHRYPSRDECSKCFADCTKVLDVWMADGTSAPPNMWAMPRALRGESATNTEYTLRRKDTGEIWIGSYSFAPIRDASGAIVGSVVVARDITESKRNEEALRESEERARLLEDTLTQGVVYRDREGKVVRMNPAAEVILGRSIEELFDYSETVEYDALRENGSPFPKSEHPIMEALRTGKVVSKVVMGIFNQRMKMYRWLMIDAVPLFHLGEDTPYEAYTIFSDITEQKQAERSIRESRAKLSAALNGMTDAVFISDKDGRFIEFNEAFATFHKFRNKDDAATTLSEYPEFLDVYMDDGTLAPLEKWAVPRALRGEIVTNAEYTLRRKDTGETWVGLYSFAPIRDEAGAIVGSVVVGRDITNRKRMEQELRQTSDLLRAITKYSPDIIFAKDCQCRVVHASDSLLHLLGKKPEEVLGKTDAEFYADPKVGEVIMENDRIVRETGLPLVVEERPELPDGTFRTFRSTKVPWLSDDGSLLGTFGIAVDINELKTKEQELSEAREAAERADLSKSKFLAAASHDLRQPVQSLALLLTVLEKHASKNPKIIKTAEMMKLAIDGLTGMLSSILDISRLDAGAVTPAMKGLDVGEVICRLASEYALTAKNKGLSLRSAPRDLRAWTDPDLLERALRNLIENALRYTTKGGILVGVRQRGERVSIDVVDTGIGIPADKKAEIFEEFYQVNNPGRDGSQGMGLGLSIVARVARLIGAEVQVASQVGRGSRFSLLLPIHYGEDVIVMDQKSAVLDDPGGHILLIEDNATLRQGLQVVLESWGYMVLTAVNGEEALDIAARLDWEFDAILADYRLGPGLTGIETAQEIEHRTGKSIPTLVLTGDTAKERIAEILTSGFAILHKPVNAEDLRQNLAKLLSAEDKVPLSPSAVS
jgi:PAS domain S-box-containing protein